MPTRLNYRTLGVPPAGGSEQTGGRQTETAQRIVEKHRLVRMELRSQSARSREQLCESFCLRHS